MDSRSLIPGIILIGLGVFFLIVQTIGVGGEAVVAVIGAGFLVAYAVTRNYRFLVPGGIMTGLGLGIVWETQIGGGGGAVLIGLGLGFIGIYLIDRVSQRRPGGWWPLIPGGIVGTIGLLVAADTAGVIGEAGRYWPIGLIAVGAFLLLLQLRSPAARDSEGTPDRSASEAPR